VSAVESGHCTIGFSFDRLLFEIVPLIDGRFSTSHADLDLYAAVLPVEPERNEGLAFNRAGRKQFGNLRLVQQKFAAPFWFVLGMTRPFVRLNICVVEVNLVILDARKGVIKIRKAGPDRFHLGALQRDASFYLFENLIVVKRAAIRSDLGGHKSPPREVKIL